MAMRIFIIENK